jgi:peptidoglycan-N-acetylglucosamine deacetylase
MKLLRTCLALALLMTGFTARAGEVALTFDDAPTYGPHRPIEEAAALTTDLLAGLQRHHFPAIAFVNEKQLEGPDKPQRIELLRRWLDAGLDLGNHSYSHPSLTRMPVDRYIADVARGEVVTKALLASKGRTDHWFRYPFLATGPTLEIRRKFEHWLATHGYRVAPVTMENSDWEFGDAYNEALGQHDQAAAARIRRAYLAYTTAVVPWYRQASVALLGREIRFVFLLHASRLNADSMDELAAILRHEHLEAITLQRAMRDPAYKLRDDYAGPDGDEWLTRWSRTLHKDLPYASMPQVPAEIEAAEARSNAPPPPISKGG